MGRVVAGRVPERLNERGKRLTVSPADRFCLPPNDAPLPPPPPYMGTPFLGGGVGGWGGPLFLYCCRCASIWT